MPILDFATLDASLAFHGFACSNDFLSAVSIMRVDAMIAAFGSYNLGTLSFSRYHAHAAFSLFVMGALCSSLSMPALDFAQTGSLMSCQRFVQLESFPSATGKVRMGMFLAVLDYSMIESSVPLSVLTWMKFGSPVLGLNCFSSSPIVPSWTSASSSIAFRCLARTDSPITVLNHTHADAAFISQSWAQLDACAFVADFFESEFALSIRSFSQLGTLMFVLSNALTGSCLLTRALGCIESSLAVLGKSCIGLRPFIVDFCSVGSFVSLQFALRIDLALPSLDHLNLGAFLSAKVSAQVGMGMLAYGFARSGTPTFASDPAQARPILIVRVFA